MGGSDCDDTLGTVNPSATETCDGIDNNCAAGVDEIGAQGCALHYIDGDSDGFGVASACTCGPAFPYTATVGGDCYDSNDLAYPGQTSFFSSHRGDGSFDYELLLLDHVSVPRHRVVPGGGRPGLFVRHDRRVGDHPSRLWRARGNGS